MNVRLCEMLALEVRCLSSNLIPKQVASVLQQSLYMLLFCELIYHMVYCLSATECFLYFIGSQ